jgi:hypothetical protein
MPPASDRRPMYALVLLLPADAVLAAAPGPAEFG